MRFSTKHKLRILDFDIENRPLSYWYDDRCTAEVTAIAWSWLDDDEIHCELLTPDNDGWQMLRKFRAAYEQADIVTGHYIRRHDLPIVNGAMIEYGFTKLPDKLASDTKLDLVRWKDIPQTQEHLSHMLGITADKYKMTQAMWREANRLTRAGLEETRKRVTDDVRQHKLLRARLIEEGLLDVPRLWRP